jgi:hypothetical protein
VADRIIVGDTGSTDRTAQIAREFGAEVLDLASINQQPEGFAGARNQVLAKADGDWFLWIDADEQLINAAWLRTYLENRIFHGFVIRQTHLYTDGAPTHDIPIRLFRMGKDIRFYGCVHEQPQMGDANGDILPTLDVSNITVAHWGYLTAGIREDKRTKRNLPLLLKDQQVFPDRLLGKVLCVREAVLQADALREAAGGEMTDGAREGYSFAIRIHVDHFDDPAQVSQNFAAVVRDCPSALGSRLRVRARSVREAWPARQRTGKDGSRLGEGLCRAAARDGLAPVRDSQGDGAADVQNRSVRAADRAR